MIDTGENRKQKKVAIILLNYNSWKATLLMVRSILHEMQEEEFADYGIVVVDNGSTDSGKEHLEKFDGKQYHFIDAKRNGGYAAGNNIGIRWAAGQGYEYSWVMNSDMLFQKGQNVLRAMLQVMKARENIAAVSPEVIALNGHVYNKEILRKNFWDETFGSLHWRKKSRSISTEGMEWLYVYRPQGCCMLLDNQKLADVDFMDEHTFLYYEESILAERLLKEGYRTACACNVSMIHNHKDSVRSVLGSLTYRRTYGASYFYYLRKYRGYSILGAAICWVFLQGKLFFI